MAERTERVWSKRRPSWLSDGVELDKQICCRGFARLLLIPSEHGDFIGAHWHLRAGVGAQYCYSHSCSVIITMHVQALRSM